MTQRTKKYLGREKAFRSMTRFTDLTSFLMAGFQASRSVIVKKDILKTLLELRQPNQVAAHSQAA